jgi:hypothetical protein
VAEISRNFYTAPTISPYPQAQFGIPSIASQLIPASSKITGLIAGEALSAGSACYIKTSDGKIYQSTGASANAAAVVDGFAAINCPAGEACTLIMSAVWGYINTSNPGTPLYLSGTAAGGLADAASTGGTVIIGKTIDVNRIFLKRSW